MACTSASRDPHRAPRPTLASQAGRFGFRRADVRGIGNEYGAGEHFMVLELAPGSLPVAGGLAKYAPEFALVG
ncbi:MAG: hypothetical protein IMZ65_03925 [Planctomycetes bacterium]|nr:hypothetical protein [Planctomycetota bacterium]